MPKTTMDKQRFTPPRKNQVWSARQPLIVKSISVAALMQHSPYGYLGLSVATSHATHPFASLRFCQRVSHVRLDNAARTKIEPFGDERR